MKFDFAVPCLFGLEGLLASELEELGAGNIEAENGRVFFTGDENTLARVNINSRFGERLQIHIGSFSAHNFEELFQSVRSLDWAFWLDKKDAFPVKGSSLKSDLFSIPDCQSIIKKAIVEKLRATYRLEWFEETGPLHQVQFFIFNNKVSIFLDTSGLGLHKRGYRLNANVAPLRETVAAGLCCISNLRPYHTLYDPLCGSGTIIIEGAMMAMNIAPGINRNFSAERWRQFPANIWKTERERAVSLVNKNADFCAFGSDIDELSIEASRSNAARACVEESVKFTVADIKDFEQLTECGTVVCNPPYGERMLDIQTADKIYQNLGNIFKNRRGWSYTILSPSETFESSFGRKADRRRKLYNGMIKCQAYMYFKWEE